MAFGGALHAQSTWLTMVGNASEPFTNSIDVDAMSLTLVDSSRTLNIRVNRANPAVSSEGIPFRSYTATILVDCVGNTARFTAAAFHMMPNWDGKPHKTMTWTAAEIRPVLFRNFDPNPKEKIIRAACRGFAR